MEEAQKPNISIEEQASEYANGNSELAEAWFDGYMAYPDYDKPQEDYHTLLKGLGGLIEKYKERRTLILRHISFDGAEELDKAYDNILTDLKNLLE